MSVYYRIIDQVRVFYVTHNLEEALPWVIASSSWFEGGRYGTPGSAARCRVIWGLALRGDQRRPARGDRASPDRDSDADDWVDFSGVELTGVYQAPHRRAGAHGQATAVVER
jgi:hypothetical protein